MSDYWVKPTIEQLQAELAWELEHTRIRRKRRTIGVTLAVMIVAVMATASVWLPIFRTQAVNPTYAMETEQAEAAPEELPIDIVDGKTVVEAK